MTPQVNGVARRDHMASAGQRSVSSYDWDISLNEFTLGPKLGSGDYGIVYQGRWHGTPVAVKVLKGNGPVNQDKLAAEIQVQRRIHHPNIVQFLGTCIANDEVAIVSELMDAGSLADMLQARPLPPLRRSLEISLDCARGLNYLHLANPHAIIHRDLKPSNILLASCRSTAAKCKGNALRESGIAKIADFGLSKVMSSYSSMFTRPASDSNLEHTSKTLQAGSSTSSEVLHRRSKSDHELAALNVDDAACTDHAQPETDAHHCVHVPSAATTVGAAVAAAKPTWNSHMQSSVGLRESYRMTGGTGSYLFMAPEVFRHQPYNAKADVYSLAMVMYEMLAGRRPFGGMDACLAAMHAATDDLRPEWPSLPPRSFSVAERVLWPDAQALVERCWAASPAARPRCSDIIDHIESLILKLDEYEGKHEPVRVHQGSPRALSQSRVLESVRNVTSKTFAKLTGKP